MNKNINSIKKKIIPILKDYKVKRAALFGSCVRKEMTKKSDIDILVELDKDINLLDFIGLKQELEEKLDRKVDLVEYSTIKPLLKGKIHKEEVAIV